MGKLTADFLLERLAENGVRRIYGYPGDGINAIVGALAKFTDRLEFVQVRHEEMAAFMACAHAKWTGEVGVCLATSGPGAIHLLNGLYDAKLDHAPVLAITGMQATSLLGTGFQQEVHLEALYADVADYNAFVHVPVQIPALVDNAVRTALAHRSVSHLTFPVDLQEADAELKPYEGGLGTGRTPATAAVYLPPRVVPDAADLQRAAEVLNGANKIVMLAGVGALGARAELLATAELLASPIVKTLPGKAAVPDDHPLTTGGIGHLGTRPSEEAMEDCDALLMVGTNFPYTAFLPEEARVVQIEADPVRAGGRIATDVPLVGDAAMTLRALIPLLEPKQGRTFLEEAQKAMAAWRDDLAALESPECEPIQPQY